MVSQPGAAFQLPLSLPTPLSGNPPCLHPVQGCVGARVSSEAGSLGLAHSSSLVLCCMNERETVMAGDTVSTFPWKLVWSGRGQGQPGADPRPLLLRLRLVSLRLSGPQFFPVRQGCGFTMRPGPFPSRRPENQMWRETGPLCPKTMAGMDFQGP